MKKMTFVIAILAAALLAGACGKKKDAAAPAPAMGSDMGSAAGSDAPAAGSGSAM
jgi:nitrous oxide reductase accessory protein NosL